MFTRTLKGITLALFLSAVLPFSALASSDLLFTPASGSYKVDESFNVRMLAQSTEKLSAVEASIQYDPKVLAVEIKRTSDMVSWVVTPTVDNEKGELRFSGMVSKDAPLSLELMQLGVTGLRSGNQELRFVSGASTVAADGTGGNTLGKITHGSYDIIADNISGNGSSTGEVLGADDSVFTISSPQIPNPESWYAIKEATLNWTFPFGVTDVLTGFSKKKEEVGKKSLESGTTTRDIKDLEDGEWYFHITPKGGSLKESAHFRIAIDNEAPKISTSTERLREDTRDPNITYQIEAKDDVSGISHFEISDSKSSAVQWVDDGSHEYKFRANGLGEHDLLIAAIDKAGNRSESHVRFIVDALEEPSIRLIREKVPEASPVVAEIRGIPNASAVVVFEGGDVHHEDTISLDGEGKATYILKESVLPGEYQIGVMQKLENGAQSKSGNRISVEITPSIIGFLGRNIALSIVFIPVFIFGLIYLVWKYWLQPRNRNIKLRTKVIQKVDPMPHNVTGMILERRKPVQATTFEIKKAPKPRNQNDIVDLRRR